MKYNLLYLPTASQIRSPIVRKGAIAADRAFVHNDMARKLTKCRQIRQIGLLRPVIYNAV